MSAPLRSMILLLLGSCGTTPALTVPVVPRARPPVEVAAEPDQPDRQPALGAGSGFTCVLNGSRLRCAGVIAEDMEIDADLLYVTGDAYCTARTGRSELTCRGEISALYEPGELEDGWQMECDGDEDCVDARWEAWSEQTARAGLRLVTPGPIVSLSGGEGTVCALDDAGRVACFDLFATDPAEDPLVYAVDGATQLAMSMGSACARIADGTVRCWEDDPGGSAEPRPTPVEGVTAAVRVAVTPSFACAWDGEGRARCWGWANPFDHEELDEDVAHAVPALDGALDLVGSAAGLDDFVCALARDGRVRCAGGNSHGQLGRSPRDGDRGDTIVSPAIGPVVRLAVGPSHACAIDAEGALYCWGRADGGALGEDRARSHFGPIEVSGVRADRVIAYGNRTCARTSDGWSCWGRDDHADQRARPWEPRRSLVPRDAEPTHVLGRECALARGTLRCPDREDIAVRAIAGTCIITPERRVACAGSQAFEEIDTTRDAVAIASVGSRLAVSSRGQLRLIERHYGEPAEVRATFEVGDAPVRELAISYLLVCLRRADRSVQCARTAGGELGRVEVPPSEQIVSDGSGMCSRSARGEVHCWRGAEPAPTSSDTPILVPDLDAVELAAGAGHVCARTREGAISCWGADDGGQLGERPAWWTDGPVRVDLTGSSHDAR